MDILLQHGLVLPVRQFDSTQLTHHSFDVVFTVRSDEKGQKILSNHPGVSTNKLSYVIVKDVAQDGAFDQVRIQGEMRERERRKLIG